MAENDKASEKAERAIRLWSSSGSEREKTQETRKEEEKKRRVIDRKGQKENKKGAMLAGTQSQRFPHHESCIICKQSCLRTLVTISHRVQTAHRMRDDGSILVDFRVSHQALGQSSSQQERS